MNATVKNRRIVIFSDEIAGKIDDFRFENRFRSESDAIRELVAKGLRVAGLLEAAGNANASPTA